MIIKAFTGNGFAGLARYTLEKPGRYIGGRTGTWEDLSAEMAQLRDANPVRNPVFHYSLAIRPGEFLSDDQWHEAARALLRHLGLTANLYRVQMHLDTAHPHIHVFGSRIRSDTFRKVSPDFEKRRAFAFARRLEQQYGLTRLNGPKQGVQNLISPHSRLRYLIDLAAARNPGYVPFVQALGKFGIQAVPNLTGGHISGISFRYLDSNFKGSSLGKYYAWRKLAARLGIDAAKGFTPPAVAPAPVRHHSISPTVLGRPMAPSLNAHLTRSLCYYRALKRLRNLARPPHQQETRKDRPHGRSR